MIANPQYTIADNITTSDSTNFSPRRRQDGLCDAIYIGGAGTVTVVFQDDTAIQFTCIAGQILPVKAKRVNATGTAATLLKALYSL